jgi:hypothetical protein
MLNRIRGEYCVCFEGPRIVRVSLDSDGWKAVEPFLKVSDVSYRIVLGNDSLAKEYGIAAMPDTYLIDRDGRIAATYSGVVDRVDIEENILKPTLKRLSGSLSSKMMLGLISKMFVLPFQSKSRSVAPAPLTICTLTQPSSLL